MCFPLCFDKKHKSGQHLQVTLLTFQIKFVFDKKNLVNWLNFVLTWKLIWICVCLCALTRKINLVNVYRSLFIIFRIKFVFWQEKSIKLISGHKVLTYYSPPASMKYLSWYYWTIHDCRNIISLGLRNLFIWNNYIVSRYNPGTLCYLIQVP